MGVTELNEGVTSAGLGFSQALGRICFLALYQLLEAAQLPGLMARLPSKPTVAGRVFLTSLWC